MPSKPKSDPWFAWTMVALATLVFTNAGWLYRWKVRAVEHAEALAAAKASRPSPERVIYEYRGEPGSSVARVAAQDPRTPVGTRNLVQGEECRGGVIIRRTEAGLESTGERCRQ
ncbi:hypothetical protein FQY83_03525 [Luteimonas marina]|uniref:Uncharacterized protein n=1 Tax=Luteimonas marina TaxID=488485 RepID=A0A5C5UDV7_9GAMM|nr:hypothetical protein [Luteimonas marina]TWT23700.1 hypothetical protein FQY83_03525 [Luteimonas marina]